MKSDSTARKPKQTILISRDEMNLAEFPLTVLSTRVNPNIKTLEFRDSIINKNGREVEREWIIAGTDKFGLPTASDDEVLLGLLKLTVDKQFSKKKVLFTRYELLKILRWPPEGKNYNRLQKALDRLSGVRIKATNAFFDNETKNYSTKNFGIIDAYEINDGRDNKHKSSFFIWSDEIFHSFKSGFIKKLDLDFYLDLKSSISKRLYRYLDKNFWYKSKVEVNIFTLAHEKIGISRNYKYASSLKQQLETALVELQEEDFISGYEYQGRGKATVVIIYSSTATPRVLNKQVENLESKTANLADAMYSKVANLLVQRGLKVNQVKKLLAGKSELLLSKIQQLVSYFDHLLASKSHLVSKSPIGFLYRAVENIEDFALPKEYQPQKKSSDLSKAKNESDLLQKEYDSYVKKELANLKEGVEPEMLDKVRREVEDNLGKVRNIISEEHFEQTVVHGIEQKIAKIFALPSFEEWKKEAKKHIQR